MTFGEKVRSLREARGLSQTDLGNLVGASLRTVRNWEVDGVYPKKREVYAALADVFNCEVNYLLTDSDDSTLFEEETYGGPISISEYADRVGVTYQTASARIKANLDKLGKHIIKNGRNYRIDSEALAILDKLYPLDDDSTKYRCFVDREASRANRDMLISKVRLLFSSGLAEDEMTDFLLGVLDAYTDAKKRIKSSSDMILEYRNKQVSFESLMCKAASLKGKVYVVVKEGKMYSEDGEDLSM